jgi:spore germination protein KC
MLRSRDMKRKLTFFFLISSILILSGCWDKQLLKDARLVYGSSFDLEEDDSILTTSVIRSISQASRGTSQVEAVNVIINAKGDTLRDTRMEIDRKLAGDYAPNKTRIFILGEELAKKDIYPFLDIFYRDPRSALGGKVIVTKGRGEEILGLNQVGEVLISEEVLELVKSAQKNTLVKMETAQSICPVMFDPGEDFFLPLIEKQESDVVRVEGVALFNGRKYTGIDLTGDDPTILLLMKDKMDKYARFKIEVAPNEPNRQERFVSVSVMKNEPEIQVKINQYNQVSVDIEMRLKVSIMEYPKDQLFKKKVVNELNKKLSKEISEKTKNVLNILQQSNCDALGIGRRLIAYHPEVWKQMDWKKEYPNIPIHSTVKVEVTGTGIIK